ncbi:MAG: hypothetical protein WKG07_47270 [Hymenobacter sp.]
MATNVSHRRRGPAGPHRPATIGSAQDLRHDCRRRKPPRPRLQNASWRRFSRWTPAR